MHKRGERDYMYVHVVADGYHTIMYGEVVNKTEDGVALRLEGNSRDHTIWLDSNVLMKYRNNSDNLPD